MRERISLTSISLFLKAYSEVNTFIEDVTTLGNSCNSAAEFEEKFVSTGLSDRFNAILPKCTPKSTKMTKEQKQQSRKIAKEIFMENKNEIIKDEVTYIAGRALNEVKDEAIAKNRERMIENDTYADYTIRKNYIEDGGRLVGFLKNKFKKK